MKREVTIGNRMVGDGHPTYIVAEIGINHNGDLEICKQMINAAVHAGVVEAPKRPLQTPQREWLRGPLVKWTETQIETALHAYGSWLNADAVRLTWQEYLRGGSDNSFYVWQWVSLGLLAGRMRK